MDDVPLLRRTVALLAAAVLALAACAAPAATPQSGGEAPGQPVTDSGFVCPEPSPRLPVTSEELNLFVWTEYIPQDIVDCFELVYGIKVNQDYYSSTDEMYAKLSQGALNYDITQPTDYATALMIRTGLPQKLDKERLPNLTNIDPAFANVHGDPTGEYAVPYQAGTTSIVYNAETVDPAPAAWADLWNPEYAGRMVFIDDSRVVIGLTLISEGLDPNTTDPADLEAIKPKLHDLVKAVELFDSDSPKTALIAGDAEMGVLWNAEAMLASREVPSYTWVFPSEGQFNWADGYMILAEAPHVDAAYAWLNYSLQGDVFWLMLRDFPYSNPNRAALEYAKANQPELYAEYINSPMTNTPAENWAAGHWIEDVGEAMPAYDQLWTEVKGE